MLDSFGRRVEATYFHVEEAGAAQGHDGRRPAKVGRANGGGPRAATIANVSTDLGWDAARLRVDGRMYGRRIDVNPYRILLDEVQWRAGHVAYLRERIAEETNFDNFFEGGFTDDEGNTYPSNDGPLLRRYDRERKLLDAVCKTAVQVGVAEKYVQLAKLHGQTIFEAMREALDDPTVALAEGQRDALLESLRRSVSARSNGSNGSTLPPQIPRVT